MPNKTSGGYHSLGVTKCKGEDSMGMKGKTIRKVIAYAVSHKESVPEEIYV